MSHSSHASSTGTGSDQDEATEVEFVTEKTIDSPRHCSIETEPNTPKPKMLTNDGKTAKFAWEGLEPPPYHYGVVWEWKDRQVKREVYGTEVVIDGLEPGCLNSLRVVAYNRTLCGQYSEMINFPSVPLPPEKVEVANNEDSLEDSIIVKIADSNSTAGSYIITLIDVGMPNGDPLLTQTKESLSIVSDLKAGTSYEVYVQKVIPNGNAGELLSAKTFSPRKIQTIPVPPKIKLPNASTANHTISWEPVKGATSYEVLWRSPVSDYEHASTVHTEFVFENLVHNRKYIARVASVNSAGRGKYSTPVEILTVPSPPCDVSVVNYTSSPESTFHVTFSDEDRKEKLYQVVAEPLSTEDEITETTKKHHTILGGLLPGETYEVYVVAKQDDLSSERSYFKQPIQTFPDMVRGLAVEINNENLVVTWEPLDIKPTKYMIMVKQNDGQELKFFTEDCEWLLKGIKPSTAYSVSVAAVNDAGCGRLCKAEEIGTKPLPPSKVWAINNKFSPKSSIIVKFEDPDARRKQYEVVVCDESGEHIKTVKSSTTSAVVNGLTPGGSFCVFVVAIIGDLRSEKMYMTRDLPDTVANLKAKNDGHAAEISWEEVKNSPLHYVIRWRYGNEDAKEEICKNSLYQLRDLPPGKTLSIRIAAASAAGVGDYSEPLILMTAPLPPTKITVKNNPKLSSESLAVKIWHSMQPRVQYEVKAMSYQQTETKLTTETLTTVDGLIPGDAYEVCVSAILETKDGPLRSVPLYYDCPVYTYPSAVGRVDMKKQSSRSFTFDWEAVCGAESYVVRWRRHDESYTDYHVNMCCFVPHALDSGQLYFLSVAACNSAGHGPFREPLEVHTDLEPPSNVQSLVEYSGDEAYIKVKFDVPDQLVHRYQIGTLEDADCYASSSINMAILGPVALGNKYSVFVEAFGKEDTLKSSQTLSNPVWTRPEKVTEVKEEARGRCSRAITWKNSEGANSYVVKLQTEGVTIEKEVVDAHLLVHDLQLDERYSLSIAAKNNGGLGEVSDPIYFHTALPPPTNIVVKNMPDERETGLAVGFTSTSEKAEKFLIEIIDDIANATVEKVTTEATHLNFHNLKPGNQYTVAVQTLGKDGKVSSERAFSSPAYTCCEKATGLAYQILSGDEFRIHWKKVNGAKEYRIKYRAQNSIYKVKNTVEEEILLNGLQLGSTYEATIMAVNSAGLGAEADPITFRTGYAAPEEIKVWPNKNDPSSSIDISFIPPERKPPSYKISAVPIGSEISEPTQTTTVSTLVTLRNLVPGTNYIFSVISTDNKEEKLNSQKATSAPIWTCPGKVNNVEMVMEDKDAYFLSWGLVAGASSYEIRIRKQGSKTESRKSPVNEFLLDALGLNARYSVQIFALNSSGQGPPTEWIELQTALHPPSDIMLKNNEGHPSSAIDVKFKAGDASAGKFKITAINLQSGHDVMIETSQASAVLKSLESGTPYKVTISAIHRKDQKLDSVEIFDEIYTCPAKLEVQSSTLPMSRQKLTWDAESEGTTFEVKYRIKNGQWQTVQTNHQEQILSGLVPGETYEACVVARNNAGKGETSDMITFVTVPATPKNIQCQNISTDTVAISCDPCLGTSQYLFKITPVHGSDTTIHESDTPNYHFKCMARYAKYTIEIQANNAAGCSNFSTPVEFRQVLKHVQMVFEKSAKAALNLENFIHPQLSEIRSGEIRSGIDSLADMTPGEVILLQGGLFTGRTSMCSYYFQETMKRHPDKLALYLDYEKVNAMDQKLGIMQFLRAFITDLNTDESAFLFQWMKDNCHQVVLVMDNVSLPNNFKEVMATYEAKEPVSVLLFNLLVRGRSLFPNSHIFCSTSQKNLHEIVKPNTGLKISGFNAQSTDMMKNKVCSNKQGTDLPSNLLHFCSNPSFCKIILEMIAHRSGGDTLQSLVLVEVLSKNLSRHSGGTKSDRLRYLLSGIENVTHQQAVKNVKPEKVKKRKVKARTLGAIQEQSVLSDSASGTQHFTSGNTTDFSTCESLEETYMSALYNAYFSDKNDFKENFGKSNVRLGTNARMWILVAGMLEEKMVAKYAGIFGSKIKIDMEKVAKKRKQFTLFLRENMKTITGQIYQDAQITLDWFACCLELGDTDVLAKCKPVIKVKNDISPHALDQVEIFLKKVPRQFASKVSLMQKNNLVATTTLALDQAIRGNPYGEDIRREGYDKTTIFGSKAGSITLLNGEGRTPSPCPNSEQDLFSYNLSEPDDDQESMDTSSEINGDLAGKGFTPGKSDSDVRIQ